MKQIELSYFLAFVVSEDSNSNPIFMFGKKTYKFVGINRIELGDVAKRVMTVMNYKTQKFEAIELNEKAYKTPVIVF
jgi:hypothetical protein